MASPYRQHVQQVAEIVDWLIRQRKYGGGGESNSEAGDKKTYFDLAQRTGISRQTWSRIRKGERDIQLGEIFHLCQWSNISPADFMGLFDFHSINKSTTMHKATDEELGRVSAALRGATLQEEDWYLCPILAADNLIDRTDQAFSPQAIADIVRRATHIPFITDHNLRTSSATFGVVINATTIHIPWGTFQESDALMGLIDLSGRGGEIQKIVRRDGFYGAIFQAAIPSSSPELRKIQLGMTNKVSISWFSHDHRELICPETNTPFTDEKCNYLPPQRPWLVPGETIDAWGERLSVASYAQWATVNDLVEVSLVGAPCLPAASILTDAHPLVPYLPKEFLA
ncbi:MAG: helix-turn-helix domain-containing protein [Cyanophyceae cyanobacterium]